MTTLNPVTIYGRNTDHSVTFPVPVFLAPMEGVTDPCFRRLVAKRGGVGGLCTEFIRISVASLPVKVMRRELGDWQEPCPIALQFMAAGTEHLAETIAHASATRTDWIDLNFGCPVKRVFNHCAGSALLDHPDTMYEIIRCAVEATELPVSAKIRAGVNDTSKLQDILHACVEAGACMITMHARLRVETYAMPAHWEWLAQARAILATRSRTVPLIANGAIDTAHDIDAVITQTNCDGVMIGRGAIANPFIFREYAGGAVATRQELVDFIIEYWQEMHLSNPKKAGLGRIKQLLKYSAGQLLFDDDGERERLLRARHIDEIWQYFAQHASMDALQRAS